MQELLDVIVAPSNIVYTILLLVVLFYWISVLLGALDLSAFDFDVEADTDLDLDVDSEVDIDANNAGWVIGTLQFFNFGRIPFMIIMTFVVLSAWTIALLVNHYIGNDSILFALILAIPNICVSLIITKIITTPLVPTFERMNKGEEDVDYLGRTGLVILSASSTDVGQVQVMVNESPLLITVKAVKDQIGPIAKGAEVLIVRRAKNRKYYLVRPLLEKI